MTVPFIMARKPGKLPNSTVCKSYDLEYGSAELHIQEVSPIHGNVLIIDDLIATGGTALACADLINEKWNIPNQDIMILSVIDLPVLGGSSKIKDSGYQCVSLLEYDDE
jgi:adenine phosphoribosyltransferase